MQHTQTIHTKTDWQADLDRFRATHAVQHRLIDGHDWEYICCGDGAEAVLVLPGGLAVAETAFRYIQRFEPRYRVLAPTYPDTVATMAQLVDGLANLVRAEGIARVYLIGGSYSGLVAQCLLRHAPELVAKLVLSDTGVPRHSRARLYAATYLPIISHLPLRVVRWLFCCGVAPVLLALPHQRAFWWRYSAAHRQHEPRGLPQPPDDLAGFRPQLPVQRAGSREIGLELFV